MAIDLLGVEETRSGAAEDEDNLSLCHLSKYTAIMSNKIFQTWNDLILGDLEDYDTLAKKHSVSRHEKEKKSFRSRLEKLSQF